MLVAINFAVICLSFDLVKEVMSGGSCFRWEATAL